MANSKLSALTAATPAGADLVYFVQSGNSRRGTAQGVANLATKNSVGLGNCDNTSDANKPVSTATQTALDAKATAGAIGSSGITMTAGVLGRESGTGAPQVYPLGSGLSIVAGALTVTASGSGTVTSVAMSVPTGFSVAGSPITTTGTLAVTFAAGYSIPLTASQASWDIAAALAATAVQPAGLTSYVQTSDARLSDSREWSATTISQAEAEAGSATTRRAFTALRVFQAVAAYVAANFSAVGQALATAANAGAARSTLELGTAAQSATGDFLPSTYAITNIAYGATIDIDFAAYTGRLLVIGTLTGNLTFTFSNVVQGRMVTVDILCDATQRTLAFPGSARFYGSKPANIAASKGAAVSFTVVRSPSSSTDDSAVRVAYGVQT